ncbi:hypothetical protein F7725_004755 [Dissostichus mawsoni]|uniref:Uncharacterized protein n=1 Tax=Dissostichus mawsoni TaxID=36200 RepID=A0A7J5XK17_DISMA|nr:hypothetical protein F7725_004755 [Dissostichus mawsoni]
MAEAGVTRSDTAKNLLTCLCRDKVPRSLAAFVKYMLTKRRPKQKEKGREENPIHPTEMKEEKDSFSRLILHIQTKEDDSQCVSLLGWQQYLRSGRSVGKGGKAKRSQNSVVADTLGQVHKNRLKNLRRPAHPGGILALALKAIQAFEDEERLAEDERGMFGFLQVCNLVYDLLVSQNPTWREVLTKKCLWARPFHLLEIAHF